MTYIVDPNKDDPESIRKHLDGLIQYWRDEKERAETEEDILIAERYIDAFQSVRKNIFGSVKE